MPHLTRAVKYSSAFILLALWTQAAIGISAVLYPQPLSLASLHQIGAMTVLTAFTIGLHTCRRVDPRHIKNLLGKLKLEDPITYKKMMESKVAMSKKEFEKTKKYYEGN